MVSELVRVSRRHLFLSISLKPHTKASPWATPIAGGPTTFIACLYYSTDENYEKYPVAAYLTAEWRRY